MYTNTALVSLASLAVLAQAGHPPNFESFLKDPEVFRGKRAFYTNPDRSILKAWPESELTWCLEADNADPALEQLFVESYNKWSAAFGGSQGSSLVHKYKGLCKDDTDCKYLHVTLWDQKQASTSVGYQGAGKNENKNCAHRSITPFTLFQLIF